MDFEIDYISNTCICIKSVYINNGFNREFSFNENEEYLFYYSSSKLKHPSDEIIGLLVLNGMYNSRQLGKQNLIYITIKKFEEHFKQIDFKLKKVV